VLLRILAGLECPPGGRIAMVFQHPMLLRTSVEDNAALGLKPLGLPRAEVRRRVESVLGRVGLAHRARNSARHLSGGGERQRLALARA
jgi:tungstate transport system ATP-binding protein